MHISLLILLIIPYLIVVTLFILGWFNVEQTEEAQTKDFPFVSVLIPVKNEQDNLPKLISDLLQQDYPHNKFEIVIIDDHSTDSTRMIVENMPQDKTHVVFIPLTEKSGKKAALWEGIQKSKGDFILTTDGDCRFSSGWVSAMVRGYHQFPGHMLIGPVFFEQQKGFFNHFQSVEFLSLIASGAGAAGIGHPILCNGANLGAPKEIFLRGELIYQSSVASGDDIFLLLELKRQNIPAVFVKDRNAVVVTKNSGGVKQFFRQRTRWTFKSRFYRDFDIIFVAVVVLFTNVLIFGGALFLWVQPELIFTFLLFYLLKCFVDYILLYYVAKFFNRRSLLKFFAIHQLLYVFYVSVVGLAGHFFAEKWKRG